MPASQRAWSYLWKVPPGRLITLNTCLEIRLMGLLTRQPVCMRAYVHTGQKIAALGHRKRLV